MKKIDKEICKNCGNSKIAHDENYALACKKFEPKNHSPQECSKGKCGFGESCEYCKKKLKGWIKEWETKNHSPQVGKGISKLGSSHNAFAGTLSDKRKEIFKSYRTATYNQKILHSLEKQVAQQDKDFIQKIDDLKDNEGLIHINRIKNIAGDDLI